MLTKTSSGILSNLHPYSRKPLERSKRMSSSTVNKQKLEKKQILIHASLTMTVTITVPMTRSREN